MIGIIDYGMGNLHSVQKAFEKLSAEARIVTTPQEIAAVDKIVLPGVGAFRDAVATLKDLGLVDPIKAHIEDGKWFLGICLGLQLLFDVSYEDGQYEGLGVIPGTVERFRFGGLPTERGLRIPHMGWNALRWRRQAPLFTDIPQNTYVYFVHSYHVVPRDPADIATVTEHGYEFVSSIWRGNVMATQFHPEKSQRWGLRMLANFAAL